MSERITKYDLFNEPAVNLHFFITLFCSFFKGILKILHNIGFCLCLQFIMHSPLLLICLDVYFFYGHAGEQLCM